MSSPPPQPPASDRREAGFGMVEAMVSIFISLLVILAITGLYVAQKGAHNTQDALSRVQENARYLMQVFTHGLRQAGYRDVGAGGQFPVDTNQTARIIEGGNGADATTSDTLTLRFFGSSNSQGKADGSVLDCHGTAIDRNTLVTEVYAIRTDPATTQPSLYCDIGTVSVPLVSGVESMQLLFGADLTGNGTQISYQPPGIAGFGQVRSVLVSVVVRSDGKNHPKAQTGQVFNHFGTSYAPLNVAAKGDAGSVFKPANEGYLRRHFTFTVGLRNRLN